ncbi:MAG: hypothetical protein QXV46_06445 [Candidatus Bathyarchaeia archaeon]
MASGLSTRPKTGTSKVEILKTFARGIGLNPEKILTGEAMAEPRRVYASTSEREGYEIRLLSKELKEPLKEDVLSDR